MVFARREHRSEPLTGRAKRRLAALSALDRYRLLRVAAISEKFWKILGMKDDFYIGKGIDFIVLQRVFIFFRLRLMASRTISNEFGTLSYF